MLLKIIYVLPITYKILHNTFKKKLETQPELQEQMFIAKFEIVNCCSASKGMQG